jgi:hypothetical protein
MKFSVHGPFKLPRENGIIDTGEINTFWEGVDTTGGEGLSAACGCYIFTRSNVPWYVGRTTNNSFRGEATGHHKLNHYNRALAARNGVPQLYFIAKRTPGGGFAAPTTNRHRDIEFLEKFLIGIALSRNAGLFNVGNAQFFNNIIVPGIINTPQRPPTTEERSLRRALGL